jgi:hypothetical protein
MGEIVTPVALPVVEYLAGPCVVVLLALMIASHGSVTQKPVDPNARQIKLKTANRSAFPAIDAPSWFWSPNFNAH